MPQPGVKVNLMLGAFCLHESKMLGNLLDHCLVHGIEFRPRRHGRDYQIMYLHNIAPVASLEVDIVLDDRPSVGIGTGEATSYLCDERAEGEVLGVSRDCRHEIRGGDDAYFGIQNVQGINWQFGFGTVKALTLGSYSF